MIGVERMAGVDAGYLYLETPTMHMHTLKIALIRPAEEFEEARLVEKLLGMLDQLPPLQRRVVPAPLSLFHPLWVADRPIDPARHVFHHPVPAPGGMAGLETLIGRIASTPLDRSIPLWELHVCEAFDDGTVAVVGKLHHSLADGAAANAMLANITDRPEAAADGGKPPPPPGAPAQPAIGEPAPSRAAQLRLALRDLARTIATLPALMWSTFLAVTGLLRRERPAEVAVPRPLLDSPRTSFNGPLSERRVFATRTLPLADIKQVRHKHGVTVNDVVLAIVAGALRRWLGARGDLPTRSLVAGVPVATDARDAAPRLRGNRVSNLFTSLATDVADPLERLQVISRTTAESKAMHTALGQDMLTDWVEFAPPGPMSAIMRLYSKAHAAALHPPPFNVIVSSVRGPTEIGTISGAELSDLFSVGPILEGIGLNVTAWSYVDRMNFSLLSCPDLLPDLEPLVAQLRPALDDLLTMEGS